MTWRFFMAAFLVAISAVASAAAQSPIVGTASVIDGDTLEIYVKLNLLSFPIL